MAISYKKLWYRLVDREMSKTDLLNAANISWSSIAKLNKNEHISTAVLEKICIALDCNISEIAEFEIDR